MSIFTWTEWSDWSPCSLSCGLNLMGFQKRYRKCVNLRKRDQISFNPPIDCRGDNDEKKFCSINIECPPIWTVWSSWTTCSVTCGIGLRKRHRHCLRYQGNNSKNDCAPGMPNSYFFENEPCTTYFDCGTNNILTTESITTTTETPFYTSFVDYLNQWTSWTNWVSGKKYIDLKKKLS